MIQTAIKLTHGKESIINLILLWTYSPPWPPWQLPPTSREHLLLCCGVSRVAGQNAIWIQFKRNSPYLLRDKAMLKTWTDLVGKCALKAKGDVHFPDFPENHACVTGCIKKVLPSTRAGPHCWHLKTFLVHIQIGYIHCIYIRTHTRYMNARLR